MKNAVKSKKLILPLCFLLPAAVMTVVFAVCGLCPFGSRTMGVMDLPHQYMSFLYSLRDILSGEESLKYLPGMCLGGNMAGLFAYYLTSPLNFLTCLFSMGQMYTAVSLLYLLRVGLCGLTMGIYSGKRGGWGLHCLFPAAAFALMAYMASYCFNYLWQDSVILLPIIALGLTRLTEGRGPWMYIISLAGALLLNFYIGYILCIFSVLFFLYNLLSEKPIEQPGKKIGRFVLASIAAGAAAAVVLLPAAFSLSGGKAELSASALSFGTNFSLPALFSKLYAGAFDYEEIMPTGLPAIYCGTLTAALAVLYFANRNIPMRRRILTGVLLLILALSFWITPLDLVWHGFNKPNWYNHRYAFLFCFVLAAAADRQLCEQEGVSAKLYFLPAVLCLAGSLVVFIGREYTYASWLNAAEAVAAAVLLGAGLLVWEKTGTRRTAAVLMAAALVFQAAEMGVNAAVTMKALTVQAVDNTAWQNYADTMSQAVAAVPQTDEYVRTESTVSFGQNRCEGMLFGYDGISHYGSTTAQKNLEFLDSLGFDRFEDLWATYGSGVTSAAQSLLGVRYVITAQNTQGYDEIAQAGGYLVTENTDALSVGWMADAGFAADVSADNCFDTLNALYAAAAPQVGGDIFAVIKDVQPEAAGLEEKEENSYTLTDEMGGSLTYMLTVPADGNLYMEMEIADYPSVMVFVNDAFCSAYGTSQVNGSLYLGGFAAGETVTVCVQAYSDITADQPVFAVERNDILQNYLAALSEGGCALTKLSDSHYSGSVSAAQDGLLVLTIPYDTGWTILLDGRRVQAEQVQQCLTAIAVTAGKHTIEMKYTPAGLAAGAGVSGITVCICAAVWLIRRRKVTRSEP